jgi:hypothetical protein
MHTALYDFSVTDGTEEVPARRMLHRACKLAVSAPDTELRPDRNVFHTSFLQIFFYRASKVSGAAIYQKIIL